MSILHRANKPTSPNVNTVVDQLLSQPLSVPTSQVSSNIVAWYLKTAETKAQSHAS